MAAAGLGAVIRSLGTVDTKTLPFFEMSVGFVIAAYLFESYLNYRQLRRTAEKAVPPKLEGIVDQERFLKSQAYSRDKLRYSLFNDAVATVWYLLVLLYGIMPFFWLIAGQLLETTLGIPAGSNEVAQSVVFVLLDGLFDKVRTIPLSYYYTFVVEATHGFNKQTPALFWTDLFKSIALMAVISSPVVAALVWIMNWGGPQFYIYVWGFLFGLGDGLHFAVFQLVMMTIYPTLIQPLFNKVTPLERSPLRTAIENLARQVAFPLTKLYVIDGSRRSAHSNAYFYGFFKNKRIVLFDTLIKQLEEPEIVAVLGHELGHWKMNHTVKNLVVVQVYLLATFALFGQFMNNDAMYASFGFASQPKIVGLLLFMSTIFTPIDHFVSFLTHIMSRHFEFEADRFARKLGYGRQLRSGLIKVQLENLGNMNPDPWYSTYHYSHPPLVERLGALDKDD